MGELGEIVNKEPDTTDKYHIKEEWE